MANLKQIVACVWSWDVFYSYLRIAGYAAIAGLFYAWWRIAP